MDKKIIDKLKEYTEIENGIVLEIEHPEMGFLSYLLRCNNVNPKELGENSILLKDKLDKNYKFEPLSNNIEERIEKRKSLWNFYNRVSSRWIVINIDISNEDKFYEELENLTGNSVFSKEDFIEFSKSIVNDILTEFPNFEEDMIIWHMLQLDKDDDTKSRVSHMHILLRRKEGKRISKDENSKITNSSH